MKEFAVNMLELIFEDEMFFALVGFSDEAPFHVSEAEDEYCEFEDQEPSSPCD